MNPKQALELLIKDGYFEIREDGWAFLVKGPASNDLRSMDEFVLCIKTLGAWSIGNDRRVLITRADRPDQLMWKLAK